LRFFILFYGLLTTGLLANNNQIQISGVVQAHANTQTKMTYIDNTTIQQDILLQTNYSGLTLSISDDSYIPSSYVWLNNNRMSQKPLDFSNEIYAKSTKVGELIISKSGTINSLVLIVAVK